MRAGFEAGPGKFIVGAGPYIAYGVCGNLKVETKITSPVYDINNPGKITEKTHVVGKGKADVFKTDILKLKVRTINNAYGYYPDTVELPLDKNHLKRFDVGFAGFAGYELKIGVFFTVGFHKGLYNIDNFDEEGDKIKNRTISLSVGYKF